MSNNAATRKTKQKTAQNLTQRRIATSKRHNVKMLIATRPWVAVAQAIIRNTVFASS
jgi:hypothetical protein